MVIWRVVQPVPPSTHDLKYRLFYGHEGERVVGALTHQNCYPS